MILSHKHKFVFIKGHKVASTSCEIALSQICGPDDVITPITPIDEKARAASGGAARNYSNDLESERLHAEAGAVESRVESGTVIRKGKFRNHMSLRKVQENVDGVEDYRLLFVERNPYEKVLSLANWRRGRRAYWKGNALPQSSDGLVEQVNKLIESGEILSVLNIDLYKDESGKIRSRGWRFETLAAEITAFFEELGVGPVELPHAKAGIGIKAAEVAELLEPGQIAYIGEQFAEEFDTFGYQRIA
jgi:hypothetical protein